LDLLELYTLKLYRLVQVDIKMMVSYSANSANRALNFSTSARLISHTPGWIVRSSQQAERGFKVNSELSGEQRVAFMLSALVRKSMKIPLAWRD